MELNIAFVWHMHQPLYIDPGKKNFIMPWVRLHAIKSYNDMLEVIDKKTEANITFNFVPSLLYQIEEYLNGRSDKFYELSRKPSSHLDYEDRIFILKNFFSCYWPTMVEKYPRYNELLGLRGRKPSPQKFLEAEKKLTNRDFLDLQVWFNLSWLGFAAQKNSSIQELLKKGSGFNENEKDFVLNYHLMIMRDLIPRYRKKLEKKEIEISTTPFYHPIMPLLYDTDNSRKSNKFTRAPDRFSYPQDVSAQLQKGVDYFYKTFGEKPRGLWPSEGSVCPEIIDFFSEAGFSWAATDESILFSSLDHSDKDSLFQPYVTEFSNKPFNLIFRHHQLSDRIGFVYKNNNPETAVSDFMGRLIQLKRHIGHTQNPPLLAIILDGENPWEYFHDGGETFLQNMYDEIISSNELKLTTISDYLAKYPPKKGLKKLHPASWINNDFGIWIGGAEENKAWNMLKKTREAIDNAQKNKKTSSENISRAKESIYIAEGSDWFWWYGEQFHTDFSNEFDYLFRSHLQNVYDILGLPIPFEITQPIKPQKTITTTDEPTSFINPIIDGFHTHYLEWAGAGSMTFNEKGGSMFTGESLIQGIMYGFNLDFFFVRVSSSHNEFETNFKDNISFRLVFHCKDRDFFLLFKKNIEKNLWERSIFNENKEIDFHESGMQSSINEILECSAPFSLFNAVAGTKINFVLELLQDDIVKKRLPSSGSISIIVPDEDFEKKIWLV
jgi:alpha-amylase/alpha-mannosidase (GH57 family)